jgi:protein-disulfide isomerase
MTDSSQPHHSLTPPPNPADHAIGPEAARVEIVEYSDFECPACLQAYPSAKLLLKEFAPNVRFVYRHFPIQAAHPHATLAAEAAEAAGAQGKFWEMHALLFEHQTNLDADALHQYAAQLGLDLDRFDADMANHTYFERIQKDFDSGVASGVRSSPTFFVDGEVVDVSFGIHHLIDATRAHLAQSGQ